MNNAQPIFDSTTHYRIEVRGRVDVYQPLPFKPGMSVTVIAKPLVAAMVLVRALLILGVVSVVRRIRRRRTIRS